MKGWCHWERDCLSFLQLIIDTQRADGMFYELVKQMDDGHWTMVDDTSRVLFPEDNLALARLDLEADVEYVTVEAAHLYWRMTGDDRWMASVLPKLEKAIDWQTSDPQHWNAEYGLCIRPFTMHWNRMKRCFYVKVARMLCSLSFSSLRISSSMILRSGSASPSSESMFQPSIYAS
jgi:hypothetical protein